MLIHSETDTGKGIPDECCYKTVHEFTNTLNFVYMCTVLITGLISVDLFRSMALKDNMHLEVLQLTIAGNSSVPSNSCI